MELKERYIDDFVILQYGPIISEADQFFQKILVRPDHLFGKMVLGPNFSGDQIFRDTPRYAHLLNARPLNPLTSKSGRGPGRFYHVSDVEGERS